jgi:hypothetical protein
VDTALSFFPGAAALRALSADAPAIAGPAHWPHAPLSTEWDGIAGRVSACPWTALHPLVVRQAVVVRTDGRLLAVAEGRALSLVVGDADQWQLLASTGGHVCELMGEWDGQVLKPLTAWAEGQPSPLWQRSAA